MELNAKTHRTIHGKVLKTLGISLLSLRNDLGRNADTSFDRLKEVKDEADGTAKQQTRHYRSQFGRYLK